MVRPKILIVEDDINTVVLIKDILKKLEYDVDGSVSTGKGAVQMALAARPDLVLMDILLEGEIDGVEAAGRIHEHLDIPVIYIISYEDEDLLKRVRLTDPNGYILKPFRQRDLHVGVEIALYKHKMEKCLRESEKRYKAVSDLMSDCIYHICINNNKQMYLDWITGGFNDMTGYTYEEIRSPNQWREIIFPDDVDGVEKQLSAILGGNSEKFECRIITKKGMTCYLQVSGLPEWDSEKQHVIGIIGTISNITKRKQVEISLTNAKHEAESANLAKAAFLANISHELKTPLNSIIGFSEVLLDKTYGEINEKQEKYLNNIYKSGKRLLEDINDIVELSKAEAGKMKLEPGEISLPLILNAAIAGIKPAAIRKNIEVTTSIDEKLSVIHADETQLKKTIFILLDNAVKFTPDGGRINVEAVCNEEMVQVSVIDTGIGVKPEDRIRIFKGFELIDTTYQRTHGGVGLGLALAKRMVEMHGGKIWVESPLEKNPAGEGRSGSAFKFVIPTQQRRPGGQFHDRAVRFFTWEYFLQHIKRIVYFHNRINQSLGLLYIEQVSGNEKLNSSSFAEILEKVLRKYEFFTQDRNEKCYYVALLGINRNEGEKASERISEALKERGCITKTRVVIFPEDGECEAFLPESLKKLKNELLHK